MRIIDITGLIYSGMWNCSEPIYRLLGEFKLNPLDFEFGGEKYSLDIFNSFKEQTGTYIESSGQYLDGNNYKMNNIPT